MRIRRALPWIWSAAMLAGPVEDPNRALAREVVEKYISGERRALEYSVVRRLERVQFASDGTQKSRESYTSQVGFIDGVRMSWTIARDDRPLPVEERLKIEEATLREAAEWKSKPARERAKIVEDQKKERAEQLEYLREFADALEFTPQADERVDGRESQVLTFKPRAGYRSKSLKGRAYEGVMGKLVADKQERQLVRLEAEFFRDVTLAGIVAKVSKGTRFELEHMRLEDGAWAPKRQMFRYAAQVMLVKEYRRQVKTEWREYKRYAGEVFRGD
jgi:hypothetical protein